MNNELKEVVREYYNSWNEIPTDHHNYIFQIAQDIEDIELVIDYLKDKKFNHFVELGVAHGGTLWIYSHLLCNEKAKIVGVEMTVRNELRFIEKKLKNKGKNVEIYNIHSHNLAPSYNEVIDLLHIDAGHSYNPGVKVDWDMWYPKVIKGGVILLHDTIGSGHDGPPRLKKELEDSGYNIKTFGKVGISVIIKE